jgi:hypothetical protein
VAYLKPHKYIVCGSSQPVRPSLLKAYLQAVGSYTSRV